MVCHPRSPASATEWNTIWEWRTQVYTAFTVCVARYILDRPWCKRHHWHIWLRCDKLAVAGNRLNHEHHIQLQDTKILSTKPGYMDWFIREAMRWSCIPPNWGTAHSWAGQGNLSFMPSEIKEVCPAPMGWLMCSQSFFRISSHSPSLHTFPPQIPWWILPCGYENPCLISSTPHHMTPVPHREW